jgi:dihydroorotate dehydrogenase electron transfer subunit
MENRPVCEGFMRVKLAVGDMAKGALPGQFVMVKCWEGNAPFFMRPFSVNNADASAGTMDLLYKIVGCGTGLMQKLAPGSEMRVMGPLGSSFKIEAGAARIALIGRGVGAAPMRYLAQKAAQGGIAVHVYLSASKEEYLFDKAAYERLGCKVNTTVDPARLVTAYFEADLARHRFDAAYVCGSNRLMRDIKRLMDTYRFAGYASLEEHMACGIGACKGCVCTVRDENGDEHYEKVCKEGPVFAIERLVK